MKLKTIRILAKNTFREIIRDRILYGLIIFAVLLIALSLVLGELSFAEHARISADFGFTAIHLSSVILAMFIGSTLVAREIDKKTILTLLVRPITRTEFVIGKSLGLMGVIGVSVLFIGFVLAMILMTIGIHITPIYLVGLYGILLESAVLLGIVIFFGSFASPALTVSFAIGIFLVGHWMDSLKFFAGKSGSVAFEIFAKGLGSILPNLEHFNWRSLFVYGDGIPATDVLLSTCYMGAWLALLITLAALILRNRDLG